MSYLGASKCNYPPIWLSWIRDYILSTILRIDCRGATELAKTLETSVLKSLNLSFNKIEKIGIRRILESLQSNPNLEVNNFIDMLHNLNDQYSIYL